MPEDRRAVFARSTAAVVASEIGPELPHYVLPLDLGEIFRWVPGSELTPDGVAVLGYQGGSPGAWVRVRRPDKGDHLTGLASGNVTITVGEHWWRVIPAGTLTANRQVTLGITNASAGDTLDITRLDVGAYTVALVNGGPATGTLCTMPVAARAWARLYFDGDNWLHRASGLML
jgi:hypothetical protein